MPNAKRRASDAKIHALLAQPVVKWLTDSDAVLRFERNFFGRVAAYNQKLADLIKARTVDPGEWMEEHAYFWRRVLDDVGDWIAGRDPSVTGAGDAVPLYRGQMRRSEGTASIAIRVPQTAFAARRRGGPEPSVTLMTDDFRVRGGGVNLPRSHVLFVPEKVRQSEPRAHLKIFDVRNAVPRGVYRGMVWTKGAARFVAAIELEVL